MTDLATRVGDLAMANPVMTASGCGGSGLDLGRFLDLASLGAFVTRTLSLETKQDSEPPHLVETPSGWLHDEATHNRGVQGFLASELPALASGGGVTIVSFAARSLGDHAELARRVGGAPGVSGVELALGESDLHAVGKSVAVVRRDLPRGVALLVKLPHAPTSDLARAVADNGADGVVVAQSPRGLTVDAKTLRPRVRGRLAGPATLPLALQAVWQLHGALPQLPIVGVGGISTGADALAMLAAGATAVQVGTAALHDPRSPTRILTELVGLLAGHALHATDAVGIAHRGGLP